MKHRLDIHRIRKHACLISFCVVLFIGSGQTGRAKEARTLTLTDAIEIALTRNPDLGQAVNQVKLSQIDTDQKKANFLPEISFSFQATRQYAKTLEVETGSYTNTNDQAVSLNGIFYLNLFNGFYDRFSLRQSKYELDASGETLTRYQQGIIFETIQRFIRVVLSEELILVDKKNLEVQRLQLDRIRDFFESGRRPVADVLQQKAEISKYEFQLLTAERNYEVNKLQLFQTLGLEPGGDYRISDPDIEKLIENVKAFNPENVLDKALSERPDIKSQQFHIRAATMAIQAACAGYWPKLLLNMSASTSYSSANDSAGFPDQFLQNHPNASIGLTMSIPVFDRNLTRNNVARAKIILSNQQLEMEKLCYQINVEINQAVEDYQTAQKQIVAADAQEKYSREALESVQQRYDVNAATLTELIQARSQHYGSLYDLVEAKFNLVIQGISIAYYQGDGNGMISLLETANRE